MKRFAKVCLILAAVFLVCGAAVAAVGYGTGARADLTQPRRVGPGSEETLQIPDVNALSLDLTAEDVLLLPSDSGDLTIEYIPQEGKKYQYGVEKTADGGSAYCFTSTTENSHLFSFRFDPWLDSSPVTVYLPQGLDLTINTISGSIQGQAIAAGTVALSATSGSFQLSDSAAASLTTSSSSGSVTLRGVDVSGDLALETTSGDMELSNVTVSGALRCGATSGSIDLEHVTVEAQGANAVKLSASSGDVELENAVIRGGLTVCTTSGEIELSESAVYGAIDMNSTSGDVSVSLRDAPAHRAVVSTNSGERHVSGCDDSGEQPISVTTTSGDISIRDGR